MGGGAFAPGCAYTPNLMVHAKCQVEHRLLVYFPGLSDGAASDFTSNGEGTKPRGNLVCCYMYLWHTNTL